jgi:hypothetical protein
MFQGQIFTLYTTSLDYVNLARDYSWSLAEGVTCSVTSTAVASSEYNDNYSAIKIKDGLYFRWDEGEWATRGGKEGSYIQMNWTKKISYYDEISGTTEETPLPLNMNIIKLYPRPNRFDQIYDAYLIIRHGDGSVVQIRLGKFSDGGSPKIINLTPSEGTDVTSIQVYITEVSPDTQNIGLAEIECFFNPNLWSCPSTSSSPLPLITFPLAPE